MIGGGPARPMLTNPSRVAAVCGTRARSAGADARAAPIAVCLDCKSRLQFGRFMCQSLLKLKGRFKDVAEKFSDVNQQLRGVRLWRMHRASGARSARFNVTR